MRSAGRNAANGSLGRVVPGEIPGPALLPRQPRNCAANPPDGGHYDWTRCPGGGRRMARGDGSRNHSALDSRGVPA